MNLHEAENIDRLRRHAGLAEPDPKSQPDLALMLWHTRQGRPLGDLESCISDVLQCLGALNLAFNPQLVGRSDRAESLPRIVVAAVSQICGDCMQAALQSRDELIRVRLVTAAWMVECAWNAVAAGDIEDIAAHVKMERETRGL